MSDPQIQLAAPEDRWLVRQGMRLNRNFASYFHNLTVVGDCPVAPGGGAIVVCNHISGLDPVFLQAACPRLVRWMMAAEYYRRPGVNWACRTVGAIPLERSGRDLAGTRAALRALDDQRLLGIFPEGRIEPDRNLLPFQTGVALLALKAQAPVYPAYIEGTQRGKEMLEAYLTPNRAMIAFGPPLRLLGFETSRAGLEGATEQIRQAVSALRDAVAGAWTGGNFAQTAEIL